MFVWCVKSWMICLVPNMPTFFFTFLFSGKKMLKTAFLKGIWFLLQLWPGELALHFHWLPSSGLQVYTLRVIQLMSIISGSWYLIRLHCRPSFFMDCIWPGCDMYVVELFVIKQLVTWYLFLKLDVDSSEFLLVCLVPFFKGWPLMKTYYPVRREHWIILTQEDTWATRVLITLLSRSRAVGPRLWQQGYSCLVSRAWRPDKPINQVWSNLNHWLTQETQKHVYPSRISEIVDL